MLDVILDQYLHKLNRHIHFTDAPPKLESLGAGAGAGAGAGEESVRNETFESFIIKHQDLFEEEDFLFLVNLKSEMIDDPFKMANRDYNMFDQVKSVAVL